MQIASKNGKASFGGIRVETSVDLPDSHIAATILVDAKNIPEVLGREEKHIPQFDVGNFVEVVIDGETQFAGMVTEVIEESPSPRFVIDIYPLNASVRASNIVRKHGRLATRPARYLFEAASEGLNFKGFVTILHPHETTQIRSRISAEVPSSILNIFWSEGELKMMQENQTAQARYEQLATELIESLQ